MISRVKLTGPLMVSAVMIVIGALFLLVNLPALATAVFSLGSSGDESSEVLARLVEQHDAKLDGYRESFDGRSIFFKPRPRPKRVDRAPVVQQPVEPSKPVEPKVTIPPTYLGPSPIVIMGDEVWFLPPRAGEGPLRVRRGETKDGVTVVEIDAPWTIRVGHSGGEYTVELFERAPLDDLFRPGTQGNAAASVPGLDDMPPDEAPTDAVAEKTGTADDETDGPRAVGRAEEELDPPRREGDEEDEDAGEAGADEEKPAGDDGEGEGEDEGEESDEDEGESGPDDSGAEGETGESEPPE